MRSHVRYYLPGHYKGLIKDMPAFSKWGDQDYLLRLIGGEFILGTHYLLKEPFRLYMQDPTVREHQGHYAPFGAFLEEYMEKFGNGERFSDIKDRTEIDDIIWG